MAKIQDRKCAVCRRVQMKLYLKGAKCFTPKCPVEKRSKVPGMHGDRKPRLTDYGVHLRETQRLKKHYGVTLDQAKRIFEIAYNEPGNTGENFIKHLERRLDNVLYRSGMALSRSQGRQLVTHGHIVVNGKKINIPSFLVNAGDVIEAKDKERAKAMTKEASDGRKQMGDDTPTWLKVVQDDPLKVQIVQMPDPYESQVPFEPQLIVEYLTR